MDQISLRASGQDVRDLQARLHALGFRTEPDEPGEFGTGTEAAVREFQQRRHLLMDGLVGPVTWQEMVEAGYALGDRALYLRYPMVRGDDVRALQAALSLFGFDAGKEDGIFGPRTDRASREFQAGVGLPVDGIVGPTTVDAFARLRSGAGTGAGEGGGSGGPGSAALRERERLRDPSSGLSGATIALDAGHGADVFGAVGPTGLQEARVAFDLVEDLAREMRARDALPLLLRGSDGTSTDSERARVANDAGASLVIAIHMNSNPEPSAEGATAFYCGREDWTSPSGHRLAELIMDELTALGLIDGRTHPKWLPLLRETRMPAVHIEPCFITNPREEAALRNEGFRRRLATAIARGIERYFDAAEPDASSNRTSAGRPAAPGS